VTFSSDFLHFRSRGRIWSVAGERLLGCYDRALLQTTTTICRDDCDGGRRCWHRLVLRHPQGGRRVSAQTFCDDLISICGLNDAERSRFCLPQESRLATGPSVRDCASRFELLHGPSLPSSLALSPAASGDSPSQELEEKGSWKFNLSSSLSQSLGSISNSKSFTFVDDVDGESFLLSLSLVAKLKRVRRVS
jgi:hypothetical protein